ncbi:MAG TPA: PEGA domain-containing protein [Candidatus Sulfotelmatobacter sp.]|nr:PEGA domain-containing protein [Candidatus Sulfotelmatobacter sp.]
MRKLFFIIIPLFLAFVVCAVLIFILSFNKPKGALQVTANNKSKIYLDGKIIGETPLCKCELKDMITIGDHIIRLVPEQGSFEPFEQKITISSKVLTVVDRNFADVGISNASLISLVPISDKKDAQISVVSFPDSVQVYLDNNLVGQSPVLLKHITDSEHELKLSREGYKDKIVRIKTILGYKLEALIFLGIDPSVASSSATLISTPSSLLVSKVTILDTPTGFLRVRQDASVASSEIAQVKPGESYVLLDEKTGWYQIKLTDGQKGWISSQYAQK